MTHDPELVTQGKADRRRIEKNAASAREGSSSLLELYMYTTSTTLQETCLDAKENKDKNAFLGVERDFVLIVSIFPLEGMIGWNGGCSYTASSSHEKRLNRSKWRWPLCAFYFV